MQPIKNFKELTHYIQTQARPKTIAVVCPYDDHTEYAILRSLDEGIARFILVGIPTKMPNSLTSPERGNVISILETSDCKEATQLGVHLIKQGKADILMKGIINTDDLLRVVLDKEEGLLPKGKILTHLAVMEIPRYPKLLFFSDAAVIPRPNILQRIKIIEYAIRVCHQFGIETPKVSLIHFSEKASPKFPISMDYVNIVEQAEAGAFGNAIVDGPLDVKTSCDHESGEIKGITSPIKGQADVLIFPNIQAGNTFYKAVSLFADAQMAGVLQGTCCPVVLPSRSDTGLSKYYSIVMACLIAEKNENTCN